MQKTGMRLASLLLAAVLIAAAPVSAAADTISKPPADTALTQNDTAEEASEPTEPTEPTVSAAPTETPAPTVSAAPTETPAPTETTKPIETPEPTETPAPEETPTPALPDMPAAPQVTDVGGGLRIAWEPFPNAAAYRVFYKTEGGSWKKLATTAETSVDWYKGADGAAYAFTVRCWDPETGRYTSRYDPVGTTAVFRKLPAPNAPTVTAGNGGLTITWQKVPGAAKYRVFYKTGNSAWKKLATTESTSVAWQNGVIGKKYSFTVRCLSADEKNYTSAYDANGTQAAYYPCAAPNAPAVTAGNGGLTITWPKVAGAESYRVFYKTGNGAWKKLGTTEKTAYIWKAGTVGKSYGFTVRCVSKDGRTYTSAYDTAGTKATYYAYGTPKKPRIAQADGGVTVSWNAVAGVSRYAVFQKSGNGAWKKIGTTTGTAITWNEGTNGTSYRFTVRCVSKDGKTYSSAYDTAGTKAVFYKCKSPQKPAISQQADGLCIDWAPVSGASRYGVYVKEPGGSWKKIATTAGTDALWTKAEPGKTYAFTVRCLSKDGKTYESSYNTTGTSVVRAEIPAGITEAEAAKKLQALQKQYTTGKYWNHARRSLGWEDNNMDGILTSTPCNHERDGRKYCNIHIGVTNYMWKDRPLLEGSQCFGFASMLSDAVFGSDAPISMHTDWDRLKVGDNIRLIGYGHSMIVLTKSADAITVAECNADFSSCIVAWGRKITREDLESYSRIYMTRYPDERSDGTAAVGELTARISLRKTPNDAGKTIAIGSKGDRVSILSRNTDGWCYVSLLSGAKGYVRESKIHILYGKI